MTRPRLTTFGESLLRLSTPVEEPIEATDAFDVYVGGAEGNVAVAAQRLGIDATWVSKLPRTPLGEKVTSTYHTHGVDTAVAWDDDGRVGTYYLERGGQPRGSSVFYDRADSAITTATYEELPTEPIEHTDTLHVTGITPALSETLAETTERVLTTADDNGITTVFDVNYRSNLWDTETAAATLSDLLPLVDILFVARRDAATVLDFDGNDEAVVEGLRDAYDADLVVMTRGEEGALAFDGDQAVSQPVIETETTDAIGTGDAFVGGFLASWLDGTDLSTALAWGAATAALKRTIEGDLAVVRPEAVESIVAGDVDEISR
ncbi:bifunctional 2-dehydro-3-deoxygluconokinase/2-dehydro-3-deoxygalactonokinase [Halorhabdus amylolytica]|uniref:bifunctional 2-dehydro-3-deoxygluconokinase/2-dehydro-3- deoxygalactonokinase n=1 Tax=Halorhabdus amylolytica TaxID=2559573 RepID=UPI0010AA2440|nr:bifunctional 2-dehydro-3-deoxygluconokinase/2-dehydro-3-deoxygalactonokinase [Halorhabdus amylolytica]